MFSQVDYLYVIQIIETLQDILLSIVKIIFANCTCIHFESLSFIEK